MTQLIGKPLLGLGINWTHPLSRGLVGCWLFNELGGNGLFDLCNQYLGTITNGIGWSDGLRFNGTSTQVTTSISPFNYDSTRPTTIILSFKSEQAGVGRILSNFVSKGWEIMCHFSNTNLYYSVIDVEYSDHLRVYATALLADWSSTRYNIAITYDGSKTIGGVKIYNNGISKTTASDINTLTGNAISTSPLVFGGNAAGWFGGTIYYCYVFGRVLSDVEITQLYLDPYCFIQPIRPSWLKQYAAPPIGYTSRMNWQVVI